ncbi:MAG TPA: cytochrome c oxidase subunit II [Polyangia bacterium]|nr:cytochrome c oxidase subunit II [Polyangia bacterium]
MNGASSVLAPGGPAARTLAELGWPLLVGFTAVSIVMLGLLVWLVTRRTGSFAEHAPLEPGEDRAAMRWVALLGFALPGAAFIAAFVATLGVMRALPMSHEAQARAEIRVTGHQWWWEVEYRVGPDPSRWFRTANELHIPAGRGVDVALESADVIHSFWVPRLHGKVDLIPGRTNELRLQAAAPGVFQGACAEFCGLQHAKMRFLVVAESPADYAGWLARQSAPAVAVSGEKAERGQQVFMQSACPMCHTIGGTGALATVGPNLTHVGSRRTLGADALPKDHATLHAWVMNAPSLKPGTRMPALTQLTGPELHALVAYLEALQ